MTSTLTAPERQAHSSQTEPNSTWNQPVLLLGLLLKHLASTWPNWPDPNWAGSWPSSSSISDWKRTLVRGFFNIGTSRLWRTTGIWSDGGSDVRNHFWRRDHPLWSPAMVGSLPKFFFSWSLQLLCNSAPDPATPVLPRPFFFSTGDQKRTKTAETGSSSADLATQIRILYSL